jgi:hypothetical protein
MTPVKVSAGYFNLLYFKDDFIDGGEGYDLLLVTDSPYGVEVNLY